MSDDLAYWGATEDDDATLPPPEVRRIGERLFVRPRGWEKVGAPIRLPLRVSHDFLRRAMGEGGGVAQLALVVDELTDEPTREAWLDLDPVDRATVAIRYFAAMQELSGMAAGESSR